MAQMEKIKFLSEVKMNDAPAGSGCIRNIWSGTNAGFEVNTTAESYAVGYTCVAPYYQGDSNIHIDDDTTFEIYKCILPEGVSSIEVTSSAFYHTTGQGPESLIIPVAADNTIACSSADLTYSPAMVSYGPGVGVYDGTIYIHWPADKQVSYILINTMRATENPTVKYTGGSDGDIYVQYEE
jgi:hypothetical protein